MQLDRRKQALLQVIVSNYVERAEPVGSHFLASQEGMAVRSATIRNELAEMTDLGYLRQPHTSAGRVPSDLGYRYYVDHLMAWDRLPAAGARVIRQASRLSEGDLEQLLVQVCRVLSSLTRYTSLASPPVSEEPAISQVHLAQVQSQRLLIVVVLHTGQVVHRFCEIPHAASPATITQISNLLDEKLRGLTCAQIPQATGIVEALPQFEGIIRQLLAVISRGIADEEEDLHVEGASHMLEQPEFRSSERVEPVVRLLEERRTAFELLKRMIAERNLTVSIGQENPHEVLHDVSLVAARYNAGGRMFGWVGVMGPTRMRYEQAVQTVQYAARVLTETLSRDDTE